jgi:hypothetical protein
MPLGLNFRRAVLRHEGRTHVFGSMTELLRKADDLIWCFCSPNVKFPVVKVDVRGREGLVHRLPYLKTDGRGQFEVANDSLAAARVILQLPGRPTEELGTDTGAVLEMAGTYP